MSVRPEERRDLGLACLPRGDGHRQVVNTVFLGVEIGIVKS